MAFKMNPALKAYGKSAGSNRVMKMNKPMKMDKAMKMDPSAMKKDLPEVTVTAKKPVRRVEKVLSSGYSKNSSGDLVYKGNIVPKNEASKIKDSELYTKKTVGSSTVPMQKNGDKKVRIYKAKQRIKGAKSTVKAYVEPGETKKLGGSVYQEKYEGTGETKYSKKAGRKITKAEKKLSQAEKAVLEGNTRKAARKTKKAIRKADKAINTMGKGGSGRTTRSVQDKYKDK